MALRTHNCGELSEGNIGTNVRIAGWLSRKRDHGNLLFLEVRDYYGTVQCVIEHDNKLFDYSTTIKIESVINISGIVIARDATTINNNIKSGNIEIKILEIHVESEMCNLPFVIDSNENVNEELRLKYRFLDMRREKMKKNIMLRSNVIYTLRQLMTDMGFIEIQTPILTASSPEGARDFVVPSRLYPGKFYALPQAPQQFKQLLMVGGIDKYFQIAPCFRDEDSRADRSPGEFYQLDFEMSFVEQEDVFNVLEYVLYNTFIKFTNKDVSKPPFKRIKYDDAMSLYGSDKPDLRNPLYAVDVTEVFANSDFKLFSDMVSSGHVVKAILVENVIPRGLLDKLNAWARESGLGGLGYIIKEENENKGPIAKNLSTERIDLLYNKLYIKNNSTVFFICSDKAGMAKKINDVRHKLAEELDLIDKNKFEFCLIVDFPMYEVDQEGKIAFSHNPFSMPQGGMESLLNKDPLEIKAYQYDIVCNGIELSSGAIRNHKPEIMIKAFEIAGYSANAVEEKFGAMINAFRCGSPPHGGSAPGVERMIMLLADEDNIREIIPFPLTQNARDLLTGAPMEIEERRLKELSISIRKK